MEASKLVMRNQTDSIALLVCDADFVYLAERLNAWGYGCVVILQDGVRPALTKTFKDANLQCIAVCHVDGRTPNRPTMKAIFDSSGESRFEKIGNDHEVDFADKYQVRRQLQQLGFFDDVDGFLMAAVAKFYYTQGISGLTVWPSHLAFEDIHSLLTSSSGKVWCRDPGNLIFFLPESTGTHSKNTLKAFGSQHCVHVVHGGGPFIIEDSERLAEVALRRLGYIDDDLNSNFSEAVDVFVQRKVNYRNLKLIDLSIDPQLDASRKRELLRSALVSKRLDGSWNTAPKDGSVRAFLASRGMITDINVSRKQVFLACKEFARRHKLESACSYNKAVLHIDRYRNGADPLSRRT